MIRWLLVLICIIGNLSFLVGKQLTFFNSLRRKYSARTFNDYKAQFLGDLSGIERTLRRRCSLRNYHSYWELAVFYEKTGNKKKLLRTVSLYRKSLRRQRRYIWWRRNLWYNMGRSYYLAGNYSKSIKYHRLSYRKNYRWSVNLYWLSENYIKLGKVKKALYYLKRYLRSCRVRYGPTYVGFLGGVFERSRQTKKAIALYQRYLRRNKRGHWVYEMLLAVSKPSAANITKIAERYLRYNKKDIENLIRCLGWFYNSKRYKAALEFINKQKKRYARSSRYPLFLLQRASLLEKLGKFSLATRDYQKALAIRLRKRVGHSEQNYYRRKIALSMAASASPQKVANYLKTYFKGRSWQRLRFYCGFELLMRAGKAKQAVVLAIEHAAAGKIGTPRLNLSFVQRLTQLAVRYGKTEQVWVLWRIIAKQRREPVTAAAYGSYLAKLGKYQLAYKYLYQAYKRAPSMMTLLPELAWVTTMNRMYKEAHSYLCSAAYLLGAQTSRILGGRYSTIILALKKELGAVAYLVRHHAAESVAVSR